MNRGLISIVIPTFNEEKVIERLLLSIKEQTYINLETLVIDDSSTDRTAEIAKKYTKNVYIREHSERSIQRNYGASRSRGEFILFVDADMELTPKVIEACIKKMKSDGLLGALAIPEKSVVNTFWEKVKGFERSFYNERGDEAIDAARFFTREAFVVAGGYDETITGPEDWDLPENIKKLGFKIGRIDQYILHHERVPDPLSLARKKFKYGLKSYRYFNKHNVPLIGQKTVYFLRPVFYTNWRKLLEHPILSSAMFIMLTFEQIGGGIGYLMGKVKKA